MRIPLVDLRAAHAPVADAFREGVDAMLADMQLFLGPNVRAFEREFAQYCCAPHGIGVSSGTDALTVALRACEIGPGDEVIVPSLTFFASVSPIVHVGATPVLVDVDIDTLTIDVGEVEAAISPATRAILPVHLFGQPADMDPICAIAAKHDLRVIEDCAQAHGAGYFDRPCGSLGDAGCFSFYVTKNLGALGEAGFVTARDRAITDRVRLMRDHGQTSKFEHAIAGYNLRLDEIQALVLRLKLPGLDAKNARRRAIARRYSAAFEPLGLRVPASRPGCEPVFHLYSVGTASRDGLREHLKRLGIETGLHYNIPAHRQAALRAHPHRLCKLDVTDAVCSQQLSLPVYPELTDDQVEYISDAVLCFFAGGAQQVQT